MDTKQGVTFSAAMDLIGTGAKKNTSVVQSSLHMYIGMICEANTIDEAHFIPEDYHDIIMLGTEDNFL